MEDIKNLLHDIFVDMKYKSDELKEEIRKDLKKKGKLSLDDTTDKQFTKIADFFEL